MADPKGVHSKGIQMQKGDGASPEVFTKIAGITDMPTINTQKSTVEDTTIGDLIRHYVHGIGEPPEITFTLRFYTGDTSQSSLVTEYDSETESNYQVITPDSPSSTYEFRAIVTGYGTPYAGINELLQQDFTFQLVENDNGDIITKS